MILPAQKDALLRYLVDTVAVGNMWRPSRHEEILGFDKHAVFAMLTQFHERRLIHIDNLHADSRFYRILMRVDAHDFLQLGGFQGLYDLFGQNVEKLLREVERLEKIEGPQQNEVVDIGKKISEYISLIANLGSIANSAIGGFSH